MTDPLNAHPPSGPTTAELKAGLMGGRGLDGARDQEDVRAGDIGLSPLGTDDEAGGRPTPPAAVAAAQAEEFGASGERRATARIDAAKGLDWRLMAGAGVLIAVLIVAGMWIAGGL